MSRRTLTSMCRRCQTRFLTNNNTTRPFSSTVRLPQDQDNLSLFSEALRQRPTSSSLPSTSSPRTPYTNTTLNNLAEDARNEASTRPSGAVSAEEPYHLNIYAHKHNMHITFTEPSRNPIISYSAGNIGLRKAQRGTFDAAYQLSTYTMRKIAEKQWRIGGKAMASNKMMTLNEPDVRERGIELIFRGYGPGREAFQKALLGNEGKILKPFVKKVTDSTRLKFGGTRSPQVRRLG